jgi:putative addiction module killer protein
VPFEEWLDDLNDKKAVARILARLARVRQGNLGDCKSVGEGVSELRADYGPGYRILSRAKGANAGGAALRRRQANARPRHPAGQTVLAPV